jgi:hypothetical protein
VYNNCYGVTSDCYGVTSNGYGEVEAVVVHMCIPKIMMAIAIVKIVVLNIAYRTRKEDEEEEREERKSWR